MISEHEERPDGVCAVWPVLVICLEGKKQLFHNLDLPQHIATVNIRGIIFCFDFPLQIGKTVSRDTNSIVVQTRKDSIADTVDLVDDDFSLVVRANNIFPSIVFQAFTNRMGCSQAVFLCKLEIVAERWGGGAFQIT